MTARAAAGAAVLGVALGLAALGCGSGGTASPAPTAAGSGPSTTASASLATYTRTGGVAGRRFEVVVRHDGSFEGGSGKPGRGYLGGDAMDELRRLVADFRAANPKGSYGEVNPDAFVNTVVAGDTSTTVLTGAEPPRPVQALLSFLAALERQLPR